MQLDLVGGGLQREEFKAGDGEGGKGSTASKGLIWMGKEVAWSRRTLAPLGKKGAGMERR